MNICLIQVGLYPFVILIKKKLKHFHKPLKESWALGTVPTMPHGQVSSGYNNK